MLTKDMKVYLPSDVVDLQAMVLELHEKIDEMSKNYDRWEMENKLLRERIHQLQHQIYGRKSEKFLLSDGFEQYLLFEEPESSAESENNKSEVEEEITVPEHKRKKGGRKPLPEEFPGVEVIHDLCEEEKMCACGCQRSRIGEEVSQIRTVRDAACSVSGGTSYSLFAIRYSLFAINMPVEIVKEWKMRK